MLRKTQTSTFQLIPLTQIEKFVAHTTLNRKDKENCHTKVSRCNSCKLMFQNHDVVLVRTQGTRKWTDKNGTQKTNSGNIYVQYLNKCLDGHDSEFKFENIIVLKETMKLLPSSAAERFRKKKRKFELQFRL